MKNLIDSIEDLLIEFDEMGFAPTNFLHDHDPETCAIDWKNRLVEALEGYRKQSEKYLIKENGDILPLTHHSEWISVEERMPPALGKVLVYSPILGVYMTCYTAYSPSFAEPSVTHWMPLPKPPEMKGGE